MPSRGFLDGASAVSGTSTMVDSFMRKVVGARRVVVCVGYVSQSVLERLANWLARQWKSSTSQQVDGVWRTLLSRASKAQIRSRRMPTHLGSEDRSTTRGRTHPCASRRICAAAADSTPLPGSWGPVCQTGGDRPSRLICNLWANLESNRPADGATRCPWSCGDRSVHG